MYQYVPQSVTFGLRRQFIQVREQIKNVIRSPLPRFNNEKMDSNSTYSASDLVDDIINYFHDTNTKMDGLSSIYTYLYRFPEIAELSRKVAGLVHEKFDSKSQLSLEVSGEPDSDGEYLALCIRMNDYDDGVMDKIRCIRELYAEDLAEMNGWFLLTTDYMPPR